MSLHLRLYSHHSPSPYPPLIPSDPTSPGSSLVHDHWGGTPSPDHGHAAAKPTIGARQHRLCLSSCSPLPAPCAAKTSHPASHPHNTLACNHTALPPPTPLHPIAISVLAINSVSRARYWASSRQPLSIERPPTSTQPTPLTPANTQPSHPLAKYTKEPWLCPPVPLTKERSSVGRAQVGVSLVSLLDPLFKRSRLHRLGVFLT